MELENRKIWLLSITLLLNMVSAEELVERGRLEKLRKPKSGYGKSTEFWSPNFLGGSTNRRLQAKPEVAARQLNGCCVFAVAMTLLAFSVRIPERGRRSCEARIRTHPHVE
ncbi:MAG: hypothetical protein WB586_21660 [Chthoniobacterales bacterium]